MNYGPTIEWGKHSLYGFQALTPGDIFFPWSIPTPQMGGAYWYEIRRTMAGRFLMNRRDISDAVARLRKIWLNSYARSWTQLDPAEQEAYSRRYHTNHSLPFRHYKKGVKDPRPDLPGDLILIKVDQDLTDDELVRRFTETLKAEGFRTRRPLREATETVQRQLTALVAQRVADCCEPLDAWTFVRQLNGMVPSEKGKAMFSRREHFEEACARFLLTESTLRVGLDPNGLIDVSLKATTKRVI